MYVGGMKSPHDSFNCILLLGLRPPLFGSIHHGAKMPTIHHIYHHKKKTPVVHREFTIFSQPFVHHKEPLTSNIHHDYLIAPWPEHSPVGRDGESK